MPARSITSGAGPGPWRAVLLLAALAGTLAALPAAVAERVYARGLYPPLQRAVTGASNLVPIALFDVVLIGLVVVVGLVWRRGLARPVRARDGVWSALAATTLRTLVVAAAGLVWFQIAWGLHYARPAVDVRLSLSSGAPTPVEVAALLTRAVAGANADHAAAHALGFPDAAGVPPALVQALHAVQRDDGQPAPATPGRPKRTLLGWYFRAAGVDGLTAPAFLETLLNPDLTGAERPFVLAHEWAHLAGYAPEADANFVAWRATQRADPPARYSGWLFLLSEASRQVPGETRRAALEALAPGPRDDLAAIARRAAAAVEVVQRVGWRVYDGYLRSQGVAEGVASYSRVVELIVRAERGSSPGSSRP
ncbi:MAG: DUF3810 family protein [Vicinamibacterales bacterium]